MDSLMFFCVFSPKPLYNVSRFSLHAYSNSPSDSTSNSFQIVAIFFGPIPFIPNISIIPGGVFRRYSLSKLSCPVSICSTIFLPIASPIPLIVKIFSAGNSAKGVGNLSIVNAADAYDFALKLLSPCISISLDKSEKFSAIT